MFGIPSPYIIGGLLFIGFLGGYKVKDWQCDAAYAKVLEKAEKQRVQMQDTINAKSVAYEEARASADERSVERTNTVREIYRTAPAPHVSCSPPANAVSLLIESIGNTGNAGAASKPR